MNQYFFFLPQDSCHAFGAGFGTIPEPRRTSGQAGPVLQNGLEETSLRKEGWCFHLPRNEGRQSQGCSPRAPGT